MYKEKIHYVKKLTDSLFALKGETQQSVVKKLNERFNKKMTQPSLSKKLSSGTLPVPIFFAILDILGYNFEIK
ncbi:MAG: hypothetical protein LBJ74_03870 [Heliobacteriaceae bacterium]|jgi:hypothetical protein|nr:hypothetical protein [Heliobacteriaceae bacterium]